MFKKKKKVPIKYKVLIKIPKNLFIKAKCNKGNYEEEQCVEDLDIPNIKTYYKDSVVLA